MLESDKGDVSVDARDSKIPHANAWAWGLCWLMFASTVLNYMDRQTITLVKDQIATAFAIKSDVDFGWILAAFSMTYALFQVPAGYLVDRWDLRGLCGGGGLVVAGGDGDRRGAEPGYVDRLSCPAGRGRIVQLAGAAARDGPGFAPRGPQPR